MSRARILATAFAALAFALAPSLSFARAGGGASMGSRGGFTFSAPPVTRTAPYSASPFDRSITPQVAPRPYATPYGSPLSPYRGHSPFMSGLLGGLLGAGIGGLLFGHGLFGGISGMGGFLGFLLQMFLLVWVGRMVLRMVTGRRTATAGPSMFSRGTAFGGSMGGGMGPRPAPGHVPAPLTVTKADFDAFERLLKDVQAAWTAHDLPRLEGVATQEMVSYFGEQLAEQQSRGLHNAVTDVKLEQGDLAQAWSEGSREYATVAMRFSMNDVTTDRMGRVVEGDPTLRTMVTEIWTFVRAPGGRWLLSAIQQAR